MGRARFGLLFITAQWQGAILEQDSCVNLHGIIGRLVNQILYGFLLPIQRSTDFPLRL
jgi:hypothetical protein